MRRALGYLLAVSLLLAGIVAFSAALFGMLVDVRLDLPVGFVRTSFFAVLVFLVLLILRYFLLLWFSYLGGLDESHTTTDRTPLVSVIVPAYNEGALIQQSIRSIFELDYPRLEIVVVDDGSEDDTCRRARTFEGDHGRVRVKVIRKANGGKASALNMGIASARGELVLCMDADSTLAPGSLRAAVSRFADPNLAAVAGNVKVANRSNLLARLQALEYVEGLNMVRQAQSFFRAVNVVPGPIGVFRRSALEQVGGYASDTFAEDCDLTLELLTHGFKIQYEPRAIAYTEVPEHVLDLLKQRYRWTRGILQALVKHRRALVDPRLGPASMGTLWYMIFEGLVWPWMNVFAHLLFIFFVYQTGTPLPLVFWFSLLTVLDMAAALYCVASEEEQIWLVPHAVLYRLFFALTIDFAKVFASLEELLRLRMDWGKLERIGRA